MSGERAIRLERERFTATPMVAAQLGGHRVLVTLTPDGPYACTDRCPHRGAPLSVGGQVVTPFAQRDGRLGLGAPLSAVRCPWHKWDFDLATGACAVDDRLRLRTYHAWLEGDDVVVSLDPPVREELAS